MNTRIWAYCVLTAATALTACTGDNEDGVIEHPDAATSADVGALLDDSGDAGSEAATASDPTDGASSADGTSDAAALEASTDSASSDSATPNDAATLNDAPTSPDATSLTGDAGPPDATFHLANQASTNLMSTGDVGAKCAAATTAATPGSYVMTCTEQSPSGCRTIEVSFAKSANSGPQTGEVYSATTTTPPGIGQAVVRYRESVSCTSSSANTWTQAQPGGDLTITLGADTAFDFTLHAVGMGPSSNGTENVNAQGTFTLTGSGRAYGLF